MPEWEVNASTAKGSNAPTAGNRQSPSSSGAYLIEEEAEKELLTELIIGSGMDHGHVRM